MWRIFVLDVKIFLTYSCKNDLSVSWSNYAVSKTFGDAHALKMRMYLFLKIPYPLLDPWCCLHFPQKKLEFCSPVISCLPLWPCSVTTVILLLCLCVRLWTGMDACSSARAGVFSARERGPVAAGKPITVSSNLSQLTTMSRKFNIVRLLSPASGRTTRRDFSYVEPSASCLWSSRPSLACASVCVDAVRTVEGRCTRDRERTLTVREVSTLPRSSPHPSSSCELSWSSLQTLPAGLFFFPERN